MDRTAIVLTVIIVGVIAYFAITKVDIVDIRSTTPTSAAAGSRLPSRRTWWIC